MIVDPGQHPQPSIAVLRQAYGLSPAEARLAAEIGKGRDLKEIAAGHGVSEGTVRAQLKAIFAKTDTHRQAELVALINRLISPLLKG
jgi:DNA-binding CsgD family transcriptional regulator